MQRGYYLPSNWCSQFLFKNYLFLIMCVRDGVCVWVCPCECSSHGAQERLPGPLELKLQVVRSCLTRVLETKARSSGSVARWTLYCRVISSVPWSNFGHDLILMAQYPTCIYSHLSFTYLRWMVFLYDCKEGILVLASIEIVQGIWAGRSFTLSCEMWDVWAPCRAGPTLLMKNSILAPKCICASFKWQSQ